MTAISLKLVLATQNQYKIKEVKAALRGLHIQILTLPRQNKKLRETGQTLEENAIQKAKAVFKLTGLPSLADDSGLEVDYLEGAPGVNSSRYAGKNATYLDNNLRLLKELKTVPARRRRARFRCVLALALSEKRIDLVQGRISGLILSEMRGKNGFGYDPVFYVKKYNRTLAQLSLKEKNKVSHRGRALRKLKSLLLGLTKNSSLT